MKNRLDLYLAENNIVRSRNVAQDLIKKNLVKVNGIIINKSNYLVNETDVIELIENEKYVSRGAYKLAKAIDYFKIDLNNKIAIDIGASTGGFSQVLIENDVKKIYAIDVGINQLDPSLKSNNKVINLENTNFKDVNKNLFNEKIDFICIDVSFISVYHILKKINDLDFKQIKLIVLLKPQFELGKKILKTKGYAKLKEHEKIIENFKNACNQFNFKINGYIESPILGAKKNNIEYLFFLEK